MNKRVIIIAVIIVAILSFLVIKRKDIYKYIQKKEYEVVSMGDLSINYFNGKKINCSIDSVCDYSFAVSNSSDENLSFNIGLLNTVITVDDVENIKYTLKANEKNYEKQSLPIDGNLVSKVILPHQTIKFEFSVFYDGSAKKGKITSEIYVILDDNIEESFPDLILSNNMVNSSQTQIGYSKSTTNEGLINANDDISTSYFFRGNVDNNYVKFAGLDWRIVRINGNNTIRLILASDIDGTNWSYNSGANINGDYALKGDFSKSDISNSLINWYNNNLKDYDDLIANSKFCIDSISSNSEGDYKYYSSYTKNQLDKTFSLSCEDSFESKIGLISLDEVIFAGAVIGEENTDFYLYNQSIGDSWWTTSPAYLNTMDGSVMVYSVGNNGQIETRLTTDQLAKIRPVISLNSTVTATGSGKIDDPYVID